MWGAPTAAELCNSHRAKQQGGMIVGGCCFSPKQHSAARPRRWPGDTRGSPGRQLPRYLTIVIVRNIPSWKWSRPSSAFIAQ
jgi:hypothetical protein